MSDWVNSDGLRSWERVTSEPITTFLDKIIPDGIRVYLDLDSWRYDGLEYWEKITPAQVQMCIKDGVDINMLDEFGGEMIQTVAWFVNTLDKAGNAPLHVASWFNENPKVFTTLLNAGANVHAKDKYGKTPLHGAAGYNKNPKVITILLDAGADVNAMDEHMTTPLHDAIWLNENPEVVRLLLDAGANVNVYTQAQTDVAVGTPSHIQTEYIEGTPLHIAIECNKIEAITALLDAGANVNAPSGGNITPLHLAAQYSKNSQIILTLLEAGADGTLRDADGKTAFDFAKENAYIKDTDIYWKLNNLQY